jgi:methylglutaconyl-CoA hydratase
MIDVTVHDGLKVITLNRKEKANAISKNLLNELQNAVIHPHEKINCILFTGSGERVFCAGADLEERQTMSPTEIIEFLDQFRSTLSTIESLPMPTIVSLNGFAFGGGLELALSCDIRLMKEDTSIGLTETKLGIIPGAGGTQRLSRLIGESQAKDLIFRGAKINSKMALQLGIVNQVFNSETYHEEVKDYIEQILSSAPLSVQFSKQAIQKGRFIDLEQGLDLERRQYLKTLETKDRLEALKAFNEKRKPIFQGE